MKFNRCAVATAVLALALVGCSSSVAPPVGSALPNATDTPTARPTVAPTARPTSVPVAIQLATRIVAQLDELALLADGGDGEATAQWGIDETNWATENLADLYGEGHGLGDYATNLIALLDAVTEGTDQTDAVYTLLAMRGELATFAGLPARAAVSTPEPKPATIYPKSYAALSSRDWARVVKAPDNYLGNGYKVWACISQFDAATGLGAFRGQASYRNEDYWYSDGVNTFFNGDEAGLADFVESDIVAMDVMSLGSYSYDTQNGGNTTAPLFLVMKIQTKGSCE